MSRYAKAATAVAGAALIALHSALFGDNHVDPGEAVQIGIAAFTAFQVWLTANTPNARHAKAVTAGALAVLSLLVANLTGGINSAEVVNLIIAGLTAAGVFAVRNSPAVTAEEQRARYTV